MKMTLGPTSSSTAPGVGRPEPRLLVLDDDPVVLAFVQALGRRQLFEVVVARTAEQALDLAQKTPCSAALIDVHLGPQDLRGTQVPSRLRQLPGYQHLPVAFISSDSSLEARAAAARAGAMLYLLKPLDPEMLAFSVHQLVSRATTGSELVLIADASAAEARQLADFLAAASIGSSIVSTGEELLEALAGTRPAMILIDAALPTAGGIDTCRAIRAMPRWQDLPLLLLTQGDGRRHQIDANSAGADGCVAKPVFAEDLLIKVRFCLERARRLGDRNDRDLLTGLHLRRAFMDSAAARFSEAQRRGKPYSLAMVDLDDFKQINDRYGHSAGDRVLTAFGRLCSSRLRPEDFKGRWGGEEFCLALPEQGSALASKVLERLLAEFSALEFSSESGESFSLSFSAGVASYPEDAGADNLKAIIELADQRLYRAKREGKARVLGQAGRGQA